MCLVPLFFNGFKVACGKCPECLKNQRSDWIYRADQECYQHKFNYFITLTFNNDHLPDNEDSAFDIFSAFRKKLWSVVGKKSYLCTLERGEKYDRFHFHLLLYSDCSISKNLIRSLWCNGFIKSNSITKRRIRYTCSYMFKSDDVFNKVRMYRSSNGFGGVPLLPYRVRVVRGQTCAVPLPRYYCKKFPEAKAWSKQYYENMSFCNDFDSVYLRCRERFNKFRFGFGKKKNDLTYESFILGFLKARVRRYKTFTDPRDLIAFPGPDSYRGLSRTYSELLRRVKPYLRFYGDRRSGNPERYLMIDCPMSLRELATKVWNRLKNKKHGPPCYVYKGDFEKKQLTLM